MLSLLRDLFEHQAYADATVINVIRHHEVASRDLELRTKLHHILLAHRYWTHLSQGLPFVVDEEAKLPDSLDLVATRFQETQNEDHAWFSRLQETDLNRTLESPFFAGRTITERDGLMQVCLHSQGHRSQCASRLRQLGGEPPAVDFVLWVKDRPAPAWDGSSL